MATMSSTTTTTTLYKITSHKNNSYKIPSSSFLVHQFTTKETTLKPRPKRTLLFVTKASSNNDASITEVEEFVNSESSESDSSIEVPQGPPSLISALNVERALRGIPIIDIDYYGTLGVSRGCSIEQVTVAYKNKVEEFLNQGLDEEQLNKKMELLKESYTILSSEEERRMYDWSLARSDKPEKYKWPFEVEKAKIPPQDPPPVIANEEDERPTQLVGYFFLGWLVLSSVLSIALARR